MYSQKKCICSWSTNWKQCKHIENKEEWDQIRTPKLGGRNANRYFHLQLQYLDELSYENEMTNT